MTESARDRNALVHTDDVATRLDCRGDFGDEGVNRVRKGDAGLRNRDRHRHGVSVFVVRIEAEGRTRHAGHVRCAADPLLKRQSQLVKVGQ